MGSIMLKYIDRFRHDRRQRLVLGSVLLVLALVVSLIVYWQLRYTGITMTNETYCGYEEHVHTDECYEYTLICALEETEGHTHDDSCYEEQQALVCGLEESEGHTHDESCYDEEGNLVCALEESEGHTHDESCYETQLVLICGLEESEAHTHTDECYEKTLTCGLEEHTHTVDCLVDLTADIEDASIWEATLPVLTNDLRTDIVNIAYSQLGYTESTANYTLADDGTTHMGYTRYGAWYGGTYYGSEYSDWDSMFVAFCLDYAVIADDFTYNSGAYAWSIDLANSGYYQTADSYSPVVGDVVFIDNDLDGRADVTAIVIFIDETNQTITVIQGNYTITNSEGSSTDTVALVSYSTATETATEPEIVTISSDPENTEAEVTPAILGYANVTYTAEVEPEEVTETVDETEADLEEEVIVEEESTEAEAEANEELTEELSEEALAEEIAEDPSTEATASEEETETGEAEAEETEAEEETLLLTSTATDYATQVTELYTYALTLTSADTATAESVWTQLMALWEQIYAEEDAGTLTLTTEEYDKVDTLTDEVYYYFVGTVGYDPYGLITADGETEGNTVTSSSTDYLYTDERTYTYDGNGGFTSTNASYLSDSTVSWTASNVSYADGSFDLTLLANFSINSSDVKLGATYYIYLPDGVAVEDEMLDVKMPGYDTNGASAFSYYFEKDAQGNYYIKIVFDNESYVSSVDGTSQVLTGKIEYTEYTIPNSEVTQDGDDVVITYGDNLSIEIPVNEIEKEENESWIQDLTITKTASTFDYDNNCVTYTITISSDYGTGEITLEDLITLTNNETYTQALSILNIDNISVQIQQTLIGSYQDYQGVTYFYTYLSSATDVDSSKYTSEVITDTSSTITGLSMILSALNAGEKYTIKYTVYLDGVTGNDVDTVVSNEATATSVKDGDTVTDEATASRHVTSSSTDVLKSAEYDSTTGYITWTISFNENGADITGYTLTDEMMVETLAADISVTYTGTDSDSTNSGYELVYDNNGKVTSIKFVAVDTNGDRTVDSNDANYRTYTITYTTDSGVSMGDADSWATNDVIVTDPSGNPAGEDGAEVKVTADGSIEKKVEAGDKSNDGTTRTLEWKVIFNVPSIGIESGTVIYDYLGTNRYGDNYSYDDGLSSLHQYFTYGQLKAFMDTLTNSTDGKITVVGTDQAGDPTYTNYYYSSGAYSIRVYGYTSASDTSYGSWINYSDILNGTNGTYEKYVFSAYEITLNTDIEGEGTITWKYETTADITGISTNRTYVNSVYMGSKSALAYYIENNPVYKTDGDGKTGTTVKATTSTDGTVTWKVYVLVSEITSGDLTITDTLPAGVTLSKVDISLAYVGSTTMTADNTVNPATLSSGSINGQSITGTIEANATDSDKTDVTIIVPYAAFSSATSYDAEYLVLTYTTTIDGWGTEWNNLQAGETGTDVTYNLPNTVTVNLGTGEYGEGSQEQDITHTYVEEGGTTTYDHKEVIKGVDTFQMGKTNVIDYSIALNLDGDTLNNSEDLIFTDVVYTYENNGILTAELQYSSVTFYYLYKITESTETVGGSTTYTYTYSTEYTDSSGTVQTLVHTVYTGTSSIADWANSNSSIYAYTETDNTVTYYYKVKANIAWDYVVDDTQNWSITHTLTAEVPDETPMLVEYSYYVYYTYSDGKEPTGSYATSIWLDNKAYLTGTSSGSSGSDEEVVQEYYPPTTSGTISNAGGLTVYKYGAHTSEKIQGTTFKLYKWVEDNNGNGTYSWQQVMDESGEPLTYTTSSDGSFNLSPVKEYEADGVTVKSYFDWYTADTLYYLIETDTPSGYLLDDETLYYFYWASGNANVTIDYSGLDTGYTESDVSVITTTSGTRLEIRNTPITSFNLKKVSSSDNTTTISGAKFALYEWSDSRNAWVRIGTYTTDSNGEITITFDEDTFEFNRAYKIVEITPADGYNIAWGDTTEFYFWWHDDTYAEHALPDDWGDSTVSGNEYATVYDIAAASATVYATNTENSTSVSVNKVWIGTNGTALSAADTSQFSSTVQLYYYLLDENGTPYTSSTASTELITISNSSTASTETIALYSYTPSSTVTLTGNTWKGLPGFSESSLKSAMGNSDYDTYIEVTVSGGDQPTNMELHFQRKENDSSYPQICSVTPYYVVDNGDDTYTARYSVSKILSLIEAAGYKLDDVVVLNMSLNQDNQSATVTSFKVLGSAETVVSITSDNIVGELSSGSTWKNAGTWDSSKLASALDEDGAVIAVSYTNATAGYVRVGIEVKFDENTSTQYVKDLLVSEDSGTIYVAVSDLTENGSTGTKISDVDLSSYFSQAFVQYTSDWYGEGTALSGTLTSLSILVPASTETTSKTYYVAWDDTSRLECYLYNGYPAWVGIDATYRNDTVKSYLMDDEAVIRVYYTASSDSETLYTVIQSYETGVNDGSLTSETVTLSNGSSYVDFYLSDFDDNNTSFDWNYYNELFVAGTAGVTVSEVKILLPYDVSSSITGVIPSSYISTTLYNPNISSTYIYNDDKHRSQWNVIFSMGTESETREAYDYENVNVGSGAIAHSYAFFDAIYSDLDSTVVVTVSNVFVPTGSTAASVLMNLNLVIQGDLSVDYGAIADVEPQKVVYNEDGTYSLYYSSEDIRNALASAAAKYSSAAEAFADFNSVCLSLEGSYYTSTFSAYVTDFDVISTTYNTANTYLKSDLLGSSYGGQPYYTINNSGETVYYTYVLSNDNNWTVSYANLPISVDINGTTYYYYYYFLETSYSGGTTAFTTTYSQTEGENGGGEIVISNLATSYVLPETGISIDYTRMYEFGVMLILLSLFGAGAYRNISRQKKSLVEEPTRERVPRPAHESVPDVRTRKFEIPRIVRKGDTRAGPDEAG